MEACRIKPNYMGRTWVMGDIHGNHKALVQCLERSKFDHVNDTLIQLGDVCDGWSEVYECVEELLNIPNLISIRGNHDQWFHHWMIYGMHGSGWLQGAEATAKSYIKHATRDDIVFMPYNGSYKTTLTTWDIPPEHQQFFEKQNSYYIDDENRCFVHGGFNRHEPFKGQGDRVYCWDRDLWMSALSFGTLEGKGFKFKMKEDFKEVFIGHTSTVNWREDEETNYQGVIIKLGKKPITRPMRAANIWNMDTGGGFDGKLTIMDVDTKEYFQSDLGKELYPNETGRQ